MRRNRQFRPEVDSLTSRILPSDMMPFITAVDCSLTPRTPSPTAIGTLSAFNIYYPGSTPAMYDPTFCTMKAPATIPTPAPAPPAPPSH